MGFTGNSFSLRNKILIIHTFLTVLIILTVWYLTYRVWYPNPLDIATGILPVFLIFIVASFIIGPACSFFVYKTDKKKLIFDLMVIVILQILSIGYGLWTIEQGRPAWLVFVVDDIELVSPLNLHTSNNNAHNANFFMPPQWIAAVYSSNPKIAKQQKDDEMFDGISLATRPETYQPIQKRSEAILAKLAPLEQLGTFNDEQKIKQALEPFNQAKGWLPLKAPKKDMTVLFDSKGHPVDVVDLKPWND